MSMERFTETGNVLRSAISPDGKYLAYASGGTLQQSLWLRQIATHTDIQIAPPQNGFLGGLTFSHDSNYVYYSRMQSSLSGGAVYRVPSLGGEPQMIAGPDVYAGTGTLSPDDKQLAFLRQGAGNEAFVIVVGTDGKGERKLATRRPPLFFGGSLAWSPNGQFLAVNASESPFNRY